MTTEPQPAAALLREWRAVEADLRIHERELLRVLRGRRRPDPAWIEEICRLRARAHQLLVDYLAALEREALRAHLLCGLAIHRAGTLPRPAGARAALRA